MHHDTFLTILLSSIIVIPISAIIIYYISLIKCYRVLASSYLNMKGNTITTYIVQQKHSIFWGLVTWWTIENIGDEWSSGSIYDTLEEADQYIKKPCI